MNTALSLFTSFVLLFITAKNFIVYDDSAIIQNLLLTRDPSLPRSTNWKESFVDTVVVAGAWRAPDDTLSKAFKVRIEYGIRVALLYGSNTLFLTGGRNYSLAALDYVQNLSTKDIFGIDCEGNGGNQRTKAFVSSAPPYLDERINALRSQIVCYPNFGSFLSANDKDTDLKIALENRSTTTYENALEFANSTDLHAPHRTIVVSSQYHMQRCRIIFCNALPGHEIYVLGVPDSEFELLIPPPYGKWIVKKTEISDRWKDKKVAHFVPMSVKLLAHSTKETISFWRSHFRATYVSIFVYSSLREIGAYVVNIKRGHLKLYDVVKGFVRYAKSNPWVVAEDILLLVVPFLFFFWGTCRKQIV